MTPMRLRPRPGMTLVEMMVSMIVFSFVAAGAVMLLRTETRGFALGSERVAMYQNGRFAINEMEKDLRTSGAGAPDQQPQMVYAADSVVVFNANYWTNTAGDVEAVYYNPDAPDSAVMALRKTSQIQLPYTSTNYPDTNYSGGVGNSASETISFYFRRDSSTSRTDDFILWRRVNNLVPEVVANNVLRTPNTPFFAYFRVRANASTGALSMSQVAASELPMRHSRPIHLATNDTGVLARIDSIRAVRISFTITNGLSGTSERQRALSRLVRLPNMGLVNTRTCGDQPIFTSTITADTIRDAGNRVVARIQWLRSVDENSGERDVERYVVWRKFADSTDWGDPYVAVPGGDSLYLYIDGGVEPGFGYRYNYAVSAQDCTPSLSSQRTSSAVTIP